MINYEVILFWQAVPLIKISSFVAWPAFETHSDSVVLNSSLFAV